MNGLPYYKAYPRDFIEGTIGMSFELKGCYRLVLDLIYMQGGRLPDDSRYISGLLGCSVRQWNSMRKQLVDLDKIQVSSGLLSNYRAVSELETLVKLQDKNRENASKSNKNNNLGEAMAPLTRDYTEPEPLEREPNGSLSSASEGKTEKEKAALALSKLGVKPSGDTHQGRADDYLTSCAEVSEAAFLAACERYRTGQVEKHNPKFAPTAGEFAALARLLHHHFKAIEEKPGAPPINGKKVKTFFQRKYEQTH